MRQWISLAVVLACAPAFPAAPNEPAAVGLNVNGARSANFQVTVDSVRKLQLSDSQDAFDVTYHYAFKNHDSLVIDGVGLVTPEGGFHYTSKTPQIAFRSAGDDTELVKIFLRPTDATMGSGDAEYVTPDLVAKTARTGVWRPAKTFPDKACNLLQRYYPQGYLLNPDNVTNRYSTGFRPLAVDDPRIRAYIGLMIEFSPPFAANGVTELPFQVRYELRERPRLSNEYRYNDAVSPKAQAAGEAFLNDVMKALTPGK
ncbi:MAG: hypothetical protein WDO68_31030 [Gammaproteobacteria bacterium]